MREKEWLVDKRVVGGNSASSRGHLEKRQNCRAKGAFKIKLIKPFI